MLFWNFKLLVCKKIKKLNFSLFRLVISVFFLVMLLTFFYMVQITEYLEQRFYKDLRNEHFGSVKVVIMIYRKLLSSCKEQM